MRRVPQRDGPVAVIRHDQAHGHDAVAEVVHAERSLPFPSCRRARRLSPLFPCRALRRRQMKLPAAQGGGLWSLASAGNANPNARSGASLQAFIVHDCIILGLDRGKANSVTHDFAFYNLALLTGLVASAPWWLWRMATTNKYREGLGHVWEKFRRGSEVNLRSAR